MSVLPKWQLQHAKNRLSELIDVAGRDGPQVVTRRGKETAVVLSFEEYQQLVRRPERLISLLRKAPKVPGGLTVERDQDTGRKVEF
jgi:prevent-host-death family protein